MNLECILCGGRLNVGKISAEEIGLSDEPRYIWVCEKHKLKKQEELKEVFKQLETERGDPTITRHEYERIPGEAGKTICQYRLPRENL